MAEKSSGGSGRELPIRVKALNLSDDHHAHRRRGDDLHQQQGPCQHASPEHALALVQQMGNSVAKSIFCSSGGCRYTRNSR